MVLVKIEAFASRPGTYVAKVCALRAPFDFESNEPIAFEELAVDGSSEQIWVVNLAEVGATAMGHDLTLPVMFLAVDTGRTFAGKRIFYTNGLQFAECCA